MISIKRSLDLLEELERQSRSAVNSYQAALASVEAHVVEVERDLASGLRQQLRQLRQTLGSAPTAELLEAARKSLDDHLREFKALSSDVLKAREKNLREILAAVAEATAAVAERADQHASQFRAVTRQLEAAAELDSLSLIRVRIAEAVSRLRRCTDQMHTQNHAAATQMQEQIRRLQRRLEEAETLAHTDPLTGLANRRRAEALIEGHQMAGRPFCVLLFDLDHFKTINDRYGHPVGDQVLVAFAQRLVAQFPPEDVVCRWGGDEFLVIVTTALEDPHTFAASLASRMRGLYALQGPGGPLNVEVPASFGIALHRGGENGADLLARADATLYQNKRLRDTRHSRATPWPAGTVYSQ